MDAMRNKRVHRGYKPLTGMKQKQLWLAFFFLFAACTAEERSDCPQPVELSLQVVDVAGDDITEEGAVETLSLYIFDNGQRFLKSLETRVGESLSLYFPDQDTLHVVSWGNLSSEHQQLPQLAAGTPMSEAIIRLIETSPPGRATTTRSTVDSPDDLFYSYDVISLQSGTETSHKLQMNRTVGSMAVTLRNLQSYANRYDEHYSLLVRETYDAIDFYGRLTGNKAAYRPTAAFNEQQELVAPLFNLLPSHAEGNIEIDVYHQNDLITTVKNDSDGRPLRVLRGQVLNVLVDFKREASVEVSITPWGETQVWKEF